MKKITFDLSEWEAKHEGSPTGTRAWIFRLPGWPIVRTPPLSYLEGRKWARAYAEELVRKNLASPVILWMDHVDPPANPITRRRRW